LGKSASIGAYVDGPSAASYAKSRPDFARILAIDADSVVGLCASLDFTIRAFLVSGNPRVDDRAVTTDREFKRECIGMSMTRLVVWPNGRRVKKHNSAAIF
jgi:hypothetical protein